MPPKKPKPKTDKEIAKEIQALKDIKPKVRRFSGFGDDNWSKIDAEIAVLEGNLDEDAIYNRWSTEEEGAEPPPEVDSGLLARRWMDGEEEEGLAEGWRPAAGLE